ncbi:MAG: GGDEF domain-containing protein [Gammaproteobacteria bacterium]|nr:GGDEF domain-containing protein [Gammaproteobacteria bacterium]
MAIHTITDTSETQKTSAQLADMLDLNVQELQRTLKLAGLLQTSLEVESILQFFLDSTRETISFSSAHYKNTSNNIQWDFGKEERHNTIYRLHIAGDDLGEIRFTRNKRFSNDEMEQLENQIYHLVYPLRNALLYQAALRTAHIDALTGANNRAALDMTIQREVELSRRQHHPLSLLILDVDHFKSVNDGYGHSAGDYVLRSLSNLIKEALRACDMLFRYGGEEFALLLSGTAHPGAKLVAERVRQSIENYPFEYNGKPLKITVSIGLACLGSRDTAARLFNKADAALYQAKSSGRNCVREFTAVRG